MAILTRKPLSLSKLHSQAESWGQVLVGELFGASCPETLVCGYRRPGPILVGTMRTVSLRPWKCTDIDFGSWAGPNASSIEGMIADLPSLIDSVWGSPCLTCKQKHRPGAFCS